LRLFIVLALFSGSIEAQISNSIEGQTSGQCKNAQNEQIYEAERLLANLGYWITGVDCIKDASTNHALIAFQKVERRKRTGVLTDELLSVLRAASRPSPRFTGASHIEIDITRQVLFLVNDAGFVERILSVSTGSEKRYFDQGSWQTAHTPRGAFRIERKINGVRRAPLGNLYNPNYFYRGVAIHGSNSVPVYPASHGCVRIPRFADKEFSGLVWIGMSVYVYD
jgi:lipoprotein-anchoring transpeptidase ErfK/SrfK